MGVPAVTPSTLPPSIMVTLIATLYTIISYTNLIPNNLYQLVAVNCSSASTMLPHYGRSMCQPNTIALYCQVYIAPPHVNSHLGNYILVRYFTLLEGMNSPPDSQSPVLAGGLDCPRYKDPICHNPHSHRHHHPPSQFPTSAFGGSLPLLWRRGISFS